MYAQNDDDTTDITIGEGGWDLEDGLNGEPTAIHRPVKRLTSQHGTSTTNSFLQFEDLPKP